MRASQPADEAQVPAAGAELAVRGILSQVQACWARQQLLRPGLPTASGTRQVVCAARLQRLVAVLPRPRQLPGRAPRRALSCGPAGPRQRSHPWRRIAPRTTHCQPCPLCSALPPRTAPTAPARSSRRPPACSSLAAESMAGPPSPGLTSSDAEVRRELDALSAYAAALPAPTRLVARRPSAPAAPKTPDSGSA